MYNIKDYHDWIIGKEYNVIFKLNSAGEDSVLRFGWKWFKSIGKGRKISF